MQGADKMHQWHICTHAYTYYALLCPHFLVMQVSNGQVARLARLAAGRTEDSAMNGNGNGNGSQEVPSTDSMALSAEGVVPPLDMEDFRQTADRAYSAVHVPDAVIDLLAELRCYLQACVALGTSTCLLACLLSLPVHNSHAVAATTTRICGHCVPCPCLSSLLPYVLPLKLLQ